MTGNTRFFIGMRSMKGQPTARNFLRRDGWLEITAVDRFSITTRAREYRYGPMAQFRPTQPVVPPSMVSVTLESIYGPAAYNKALALLKTMMDSKECWALAVLFPSPDHTLQYHKISIHKIDVIELAPGSATVSLQRAYVEGQGEGCVTVYHQRKRLPGRQVRALR